MRVTTTRSLPQETRISESQTLYCLAQCTPDLRVNDCRNCLGLAISELSYAYNGKQGVEIYILVVILGLNYILFTGLIMLLHQMSLFLKQVVPNKILDFHKIQFIFPVIAQETTVQSLTKTSNYFSLICLPTPQMAKNSIQLKWKKWCTASSCVEVTFPFTSVVNV